MEKRFQDKAVAIPRTISLIGFGEAGQAFAEGWKNAGIKAQISVFDIKTQSPVNSVAVAKRSEYDKAGVKGCETLPDAIFGSEAVFSLVTADQAHEAAKAVAGSIRQGAMYFDCNSCAPGSKRKSALLIEAAGGHYVDTAVMAPVHPKLHQTPVLVAGHSWENGPCVS